MHFPHYVLYNVFLLLYSFSVFLIWNNFPSSQFSHLPFYRLLLFNISFLKRFKSSFYYPFIVLVIILITFYWSWNSDLNFNLHRQKKMSFLKMFFYCPWRFLVNFHLFSYNIFSLFFPSFSFKWDYELKVPFGKLKAGPKSIPTFTAQRIPLLWLHRSTRKCTQCCSLSASLPLWAKPDSAKLPVSIVLSSGEWWALLPKVLSYL